VYLLLAKSHLEMEQWDAAVKSAERTVAVDPQNSKYHEWLGKAYGEKADHVNPFSAMGLARKAGKEFEVAVQLDESNFSARQALIEFDCKALASWEAEWKRRSRIFSDWAIWTRQKVTMPRGIAADRRTILLLRTRNLRRHWRATRNRQI